MVALDRLAVTLPRPIVMTFGTFDVFHAGHLSILQRAREIGASLVVGVSTDALSTAKKKRSPVYCQDERLCIVRALRCVDAVFSEESLEAKAEYLTAAKADVLVMGDDWTGRFDHLDHLCRVAYLRRTPAISTTGTIERIRLLPG